MGGGTPFFMVRGSNCDVEPLKRGVEPTMGGERLNRPEQLEAYREK